MNPRVEKLPRWKDIPVPFFVTMRMDNVPDFKVINEENRKRCAVETLCWICGEKLEWWIFFVGGPQAVGRRLFVDGPMHKACADDAMTLCPFLRGDMDYAKTFDMSKHSVPVRFTGGPARAVSQVAPEKIGIVRCREFGVAIVRDPRDPQNGAWFFHVSNPIEVTWRNR